MPKKPARPQARASIVFRFRAGTLPISVIAAEEQLLLQYAAMAMSDDQELRLAGRRLLRETAEHSARSRLDSLRRSSLSSGPRKRSAEDEQRLVRLYWEWVTSHGKYGAQKHFEREHGVPIATLKDILKRNPR